jgi:Flp pilus assembly pilin Flp
MSLRTCDEHDDGASTVEYALILAAVASVIVVSVGLLGGTVFDLFSTSNDCLGAGSSSTC